jgi:hypothetical protein
MTQFADFNREKFKNWNLAIQLKQAGEYQFLVVKGLPGYHESMSYFRQVILERTLFSSLGQTIYRNFIITDRNLERLLEKTEVDPYMDFFRNYYILRAGRVDNQENAKPTGQVIPPPGTSLLPSSATGYTGPYDKKVDQPHWFVMVIPRTDWTIQ